MFAMNDYRNFQRKKCRKKGTNHNKHGKGKQCLQQKNQYHSTNKQRRQQQLMSCRARSKQRSLISRRDRKKMIHQLKILNDEISKQTVRKLDNDWISSIKRILAATAISKCNATWLYMNTAASHSGTLITVMI